MKNKIYILFLLIFCVASCGKRKGTARLSGDIKGLTTNVLYLYGQNGSFDNIDTISVKKGHFDCKITVDTLSALYLLINNEMEYPVFLGKGDHIRIKGNATRLGDLKVSGNDINDDFSDFKRELFQKGLLDRFSFANSGIVDGQLQSQAETFISKHTSSPVSEYLIDKFFLHQSAPDYPRIKRIIMSLDVSLRNSPHIVEVNDYIVRWEKSRMGAVAPAFSLPDGNGRFITRFSEPLQNKYVLLSFWASWASNRAQSSAEMRQLYHIFHANPKFAMVGISLDADKNEWKRCIKQDSLQGVQLSDLKGFNSPVVNQYAISELPTYFFIAPDGIILARDMAGETLRRQIAAALK